jgi:hypothetical protein
MVFIDNLQYPQRLRMHIDAEFLSAFSEDDLRGGMRRQRELVEMQIRAGDRRQCSAYLSGGTGAGAIDDEPLVRTIQPAFDLWFEEVDCTGRGKPKDKRDGKEAGIEVPAPYGSVVEPALRRSVS